jgi:hypothetical protein
MKNQNNKKKYWYQTEIYVCVLCGKEQKYKQRTYLEINKGNKFIDDLCYSCQM